MPDPLKEFATDVVLAKLPDVERAAAVHNMCCPASVFSLRCPSPALADSAYAVLRAVDMEWKDKKTGLARGISVYGDHPSVSIIDLCLSLLRGLGVPSRRCSWTLPE